MYLSYEFAFHVRFQPCWTAYETRISVFRTHVFIKQPLTRVSTIEYAFVSFSQSNRLAKRKAIKIELTLLNIYIIMFQLHLDFFSDKIVLLSSNPVSISF